MDLRIFTEPQQGASYDQLLAVAKATEDGGFDAFFRSDHYLTWASRRAPGPTDAWMTLAGLARETKRIQPRHAGEPRDVPAARRSRHRGRTGRRDVGGQGRAGPRRRLVRGRARGVRDPLPGTKERFDRFEEQLAIVTGLWSTPAGEKFSFDGTHYRLSDSPALPKPVQSPMPLIVGGAAKPAHPARRPLRHRVQHRLRSGRGRGRRLPAGAVRVHRGGPRPGVPDVLGRPHYRLRRGRRAGRRRARTARQDVDRLRTSGLAGTPGELVDRIGRYAEVGATRVYLQVYDFDDLAMIELIAARVLPQLR